MTALEMKRLFLVLYDKITNFAAPGYDDEEISLFLTKAQERVVLHYFRPDGNKYGEGFEETEQRRKDLQELVVGTTLTVPSTTQTNVLPNGKFFDLPADCLYVISEAATVSSDDDCIDEKRVSIKPITHDEYEANIINPFKKPYVKGENGVVWRLDYNTRRHELITDDNFTISSYHLRYLGKPQPIIIDGSIIEGVTGPQDCVLHEILQQRIIDEAVAIAVGITDPQDYQIKTTETQKGE